MVTTATLLLPLLLLQLTTSVVALLQATTTRFGGSQGSCGGCALNMLGGVRGWAAVATAESMQKPYSCKPCPACQCATGDEQKAHGNSEAAAGCGECFELISTGTNPWRAPQPHVAFNVTVVDSCPHAANTQWCPGNVGEKNQYGYEYHFDIFENDVSKIGIGDNPIVNFRKISCPGFIQELFHQKCCGIWYQGQGCPGACPSGFHCP